VKDNKRRVKWRSSIIPMLAMWGMQQEDQPSAQDEQFAATIEKRGVLNYGTESKPVDRCKYTTLELW
jgi:hypothetical protein